MKKLLIGTIALGMLGSASADTVTGQIDLTVTMPEVLVLYHWDSAHLELTANNYNVTTGVGALTDQFGKNTYDIDATGQTTNPAMTGSALKTAEPSTLAGSSTVTITLKNSWAVRNISSAAGATPVKLAVAVNNATLTNVDNPAAEMAVSAPTLVSTATGVANSGTATLDLDPSWAPVTGDLTFDLDLTNANYSGLYTSDGKTFPAGGPSTSANKTFELTLTGPTTSSPAVKTVDVTQ